MRQNVRMFWALYKKDLIQIRGIGLALIAYAFVVNTFYFGQYGLSQTGNMTYSPFIFRFRDLAVAIPYAFPTLLAYMLFMQHRDESRYLEQSLPVWRSMTVIIAYLSLMTIVMGYALITHLISAVYINARFNEANQLLAATLSRPELNESVWNVALRSIVFSFRDFGQLIEISGLTGIVCLASGVASPFATRGWGWYWAAFAGTIAVIFSIPALMARFEVALISQLWLFALVSSGPVLVLAGAWLYGRFAEV